MAEMTERGRYQVQPNWHGVRVGLAYSGTCSLNSAKLAWGKAKAGSQYSFSQVTLASGIWPELGYSTVLHHTAVSAKPSCKFCMPSI